MISCLLSCKENPSEKVTSPKGKNLHPLPPPKKMFTVKGKNLLPEGANSFRLE